MSLNQITSVTKDQLWATQLTDFYVHLWSYIHCITVDFYWKTFQLLYALSIFLFIERISLRLVLYREFLLKDNFRGLVRHPTTGNSSTQFNGQFIFCCVKWQALQRKYFKETVFWSTCLFITNPAVNHELVSDTRHWIIHCVIQWSLSTLFRMVKRSCITILYVTATPVTANNHSITIP